MFGNHGLCGLLKEGAHGKSPKCLGGNLGDFGEFCKGLTEFGFPDRRVGETQLTAGRSPQRGTGTAHPKDEKVGEGVNNINEHLNRSDVYKSIGHHN